MKILHLLSQIPDHTGSGKFIQQMIYQAGEKGHENFLLAANQPGTTFPQIQNLHHSPLLIEFNSSELNYPVAGMSDVMPYPSTVFAKMSDSQMDAYYQVFKKKIQIAMEAFQPDIVHTHHLWIASAITASLVQESPVRPKIVTTCHGTCLRQHQLCPDIGQSISTSLGKLDAVIALNPSQKEEILDRFGFEDEQVSVIPGGFDQRLFQYAGTPESKTVEVLYAGKLSSAKGVQWLLRSIEKIQQIPFRLHLVGGGSGEEMEECLKMAEAQKDRVIRYGHLEHSELAELMRRCHLFVLPSFYEGVPLVLMEALASGCRILTTELPGVREILAPEDGNMIHFLPLPELETIDRPFASDMPQLVEQLAGKLEQIMARILENPDRDYSFIQQRTTPYSWDKIFSRTEKVYQTAGSR